MPPKGASLDISNLKMTQTLISALKWPGSEEKTMNNLSKKNDY